MEDNSLSSHNDISRMTSYILEMQRYLYYMYLEIKLISYGLLLLIERPNIVVFSIVT